MKDIDLLIREQDLDNADELVTKLGYVSYDSYPFRNVHHLAPFFNPDKRIKVEVHYDVIPTGNLINLDICKMWKRAQTIRMGDVYTQVLSFEDLIVHLCLHISYVHPLRKEIMSFIDISQVVRFYDEHINWDLIIKESHEGKYSFFIYYPLYLAKEVLDVKIGKGILDGLKNGTNLRPFEERLLISAYKKKILLSGKYSSIFPDWLLQSLGKELLYKAPTHKKIGSLLRVGLLPLTESNGEKPHVSFQGLAHLFYHVLHLWKQIYKLFYHFSISITKNILRKMVV